MSAHIRIRVVDIETTGIHETAEVCELGTSDVVVKEGKASPPGGHWNSLTGISTPMDPGAQSIHHIDPRDLEGQPAFADVVDRQLSGADILCAQNHKFDAKFIDPEFKRRWICTLKCARRIWPKAEKHTNQYLRYWLGLDCKTDLADPPHRAGPDAYVTGHILAAMLNSGKTVQQLLDWTEKPSLLPMCNLNKHKGKTWKQVAQDDIGYLKWIAYKADQMDEDTKYTAKYWIKASGNS